MQPLGTPCWLELQPGDLDAAKSFYGAVLEWSFDADDSERWFAVADGKRVATLRRGSPSPWQVFLRVDDVHDVVEQARALGAHVPSPPQPDGLGLVASITAPGAAPVRLLQLDTFSGFTTDGAQGTPAWFEVNTWDASMVHRFFAQLFDLVAEQLEGMDYHVLRAEGAPRYGVLQMTDDWQGMEPSWMVYFAVEDAEAAVATVRRLGGQAPYGPFDTPVGRTAVCIDPEGTAFTVVQPS